MRTGNGPGKVHEERSHDQFGRGGGAARLWFAIGLAGGSPQAEDILRRQLAIAPSPRALCMLGDLRADPNLYREAWSLSNGRCMEAQNALGSYYLRRREVSALSGRARLHPPPAHKHVAHLTDRVRAHERQRVPGHVGDGCV